MTVSCNATCGHPGVIIHSRSCVGTCGAPCPGNGTKIETCTIPGEIIREEVDNLG